tara:strand:- start:505 stop:690 length:186 start_codon:yes stop_codon:yes gene_type:complete
MDIERYLNKDEVSEIIGISKVSLDKWVREKKMNCYKVGRRVLFSKRNIEEFMEGWKKGGKN